MNKKLPKMLALIAAGCMTMSVGACSSPGAPSASGGSQTVSNDASANDNAKCQNTVKKDGVEKVTIWAWYPAFDKIVDNFNDTHDDVQLCWTKMPDGMTTYQKFSTAIKAKSGGPDIIQLGYDAMPQYVSGVEQHLIDLKQFGAEKIKSDYTEGGWNSVTLGSDAVYGVPVDAGPFVMMYRKDIFDKYDVKVPTTWAEYEQAGKELREKGFEGHIGNFEANGTGWNLALFAQKTDDVYSYSASNPEQVSINFESEGVKSVLEYWQRLAKEDVVATDDSFTAEWYKKIVDGSYASYVSASWVTGYIKGVSGAEEGSVWQVTKAPVWDDSTPAVNYGGSGIAVTDQAKHTEKAAQVAMELFQDDKAQEIAVTDSGLFPTWVKKLDSDAFKNYEDEFFNNQKVNAVLAETAQGYQGYEYLPFQTYAFDEQTKAFTKAVKDGEDVSSTMTALDKTLSDYATQQGFTVK
ncbi:ABC transporter substrate-binding protein [Bifidobacterium scaligerum]|uniref:ABC transporter substrate-binding protein n=1 Tax=Bifidobacterium scaligerum TaxID=2052656 RepID=A0A2M9HN92_9BIFI|nr:extracellular solute-binding protein [Bifidobacterium scaligerum]PJM78276.1 ABC transporter substrate-binding protein [Bifidobacterium scaligerum]